MGLQEVTRWTCAARSATAPILRKFLSSTKKDSTAQNHSLDYVPSSSAPKRCWRRGIRLGLLGPHQDLIILAVQTDNRSSLVFGDELSLQQGDSVYALGAPKGLELSFTNGIVSSFRKSNGQFLIQTTAPIAPGSSGGPLFDRSGHVVGVTTSMLSDAAGIYFCICLASRHFFSRI